MSEQDRTLAPGQQVTLQELACGYGVIMVADGPAEYTVSEVTREFTVFEDASAGLHLRLPAYLIRWVREAAAPPQAEAA